MAEVEKKKPKRRLKRSVRRTIGALFLASSLVVAAIPTDGFQMKAATITAATEDDWGTLVGNMGDSASKIPVIDDDEQIYTTGDGRFRLRMFIPKEHPQEINMRSFLDSRRMIPHRHLRYRIRWMYMPSLPIPWEVIKVV